MGLFRTRSWFGFGDFEQVGRRAAAPGEHPIPEEGAAAGAWFSRDAIPFGLFDSLDSGLICSVLRGQLVVLYVDFKLDESYTPSKISIRAGDGFHNLKVLGYSTTNLLTLFKSFSAIVHFRQDYKCWLVGPTYMQTCREPSVNMGSWVYKPVKDLSWYTDLVCKKAKGLSKAICFSYFAFVIHRGRKTENDGNTVTWYFVYSMPYLGVDTVTWPDISGKVYSALHVLVLKMLSLVTDNIVMASILHSIFFPRDSRKLNSWSLQSQLDGSIYHYLGLIHGMHFKLKMNASSWNCIMQWKSLS